MRTVFKLSGFLLVLGLLLGTGGCKKKKGTPPPLGINAHFVDATVLTQLDNLPTEHVRLSVYLHQWQSASAKARRMGEIQDLIAADVKPLIVITGPTSGNVTDEVDAIVGDLYAIGVREFELFNEVDAGGGQFTNQWQANTPLESGRQYGAWLKQALPRFRRNRVGAFFVTAGAVHPEFIQGIYDAGAAGRADAIAFHPYGVPILPAFKARGQRVRDIMKKHGDEDVPLWCTETGVSGAGMIRAWGWPNRSTGEPDGAWLDRKQKELLKEILDYNDDRRLYDRVYIYALHAGSEDPGAYTNTNLNPDDYSHSLTRANFLTPRPAFDLFQRNKQTRN